MSLRQVLRQLEYKAKNMKWTSAPSKNVFSNAIATVSDMAEVMDSGLNPPFIIFFPQTISTNSENASLQICEIAANILVLHNNDYLGRLCLLGGHQKFGLSTGSSYHK